MSHAQRREAAPIAAEPAAAGVVYKAVDAEASCVGFGSGTAVAEGVGKVVRGHAVFELMAPADIVVLAATIRATGSFVLGIDAVIIEAAVFGIVDDAVVADASSVSCKIRKRAADAVGAVTVVARGSAFDIAFVPFDTWATCAVAAAATAVDTAGVDAAGVAAHNVIGGTVVGG